MKIQIAGIEKESINDGPGFRIAIFFQGCPHACPGCHNPQTWDAHQGISYELDDLIEAIPIHPHISGITFSGGEPFIQAEAAYKLASWVKTQNRSLWVYTGFIWEKLIQIKQAGIQELLQLTDVLVDGPFVLAQRNLNLPFRGSTNQRIINVAESLKRGHAVVDWQPLI